MNKNKVKALTFYDIYKIGIMSLAIPTFLTITSNEAFASQNMQGHSNYTNS